MSTPTPSLSPEFLAENTGNTLTVTASVFIAILFIFAGLRFFSSRMKGRGFDLGDLFSYLGLVFIVGECVIALIMVPVAGVGRHVAYLEVAAPQKLAHEYKIMFPIELLYIPAFTFPKLAILCMYLKVFTNKYSRNITYGLMFALGFTWLVETFSAIFQCYPVAFIWDKTVNGGHGHCVNQDILFQYWSVPNIVSDVIMLLLPMPTVWTLQMSVSQKIGLSLTFALGSIGLIASVVRFTIFGKTGALVDATWASVELQIWTFVEPSMYYIAGILPTLRPVLSFLVGNFKTTVGSSRQYGASGGSRTYAMSGPSRLRTNNNTGKDRSWRTLQEDPSQTGDDMALVEYSQHIVGGKGSPRLGDVGITRTQEVVVTRDAM